MASPRVEHMLDEIARLSREEQAELMRDLPRVLRDGENDRNARIVAVQQALELRERIRRRLATVAQTPGSVNDDLDTIRDERLGELANGDAGMTSDTRQ